MSGQQQQGPCQFEMQQFIECAQNQRDITLCQGFNEALRQCKLANGKKQLSHIETNQHVSFSAEIHQFSMQFKTEFNQSCK